MPLIAEALLTRALAELPGAPALGFEDAALRWLEAQGWPGNVRELSNGIRGAIARAVARRSATLGVDDFAIRPPAQAARAPTSPSTEWPQELEAATELFQRARVSEALAACEGNKSRAATRLGVSRQWLHRLLEKWGETP